ncbi:SDR family NAD(P)-dependent oxidoreductase [Jiangella anatolica]|uniref:Short-chain dehydrogenase n=1 Tax=Jiangella anatolica TaxID=2670374 RepID=A0A2W2CEF3_9ACTN|nr:glucose 1-dehydrogenase [Jiangella anatolica]PZF86677.1 short-chain dehydrogenase [Jiangella anatolica]
MTGTRFAGRVAIVTGAANGIGAAVAHAFAAEGASVVAVDLDAEMLRSVVEEIAADGGAATAVTGDVGEEPTARRAAATAAESYGGLDVLFNGAGVNRHGAVPDVSLADWEFVLGANLRGPFLLMKHAIPLLRERGGGAIVNTASVQAFASMPAVPAYAASKAGVVALTAAAALDHAKDGIRVNCVAPGSVRTPMLRAAAEQYAPDDPERALAEWGAVHPIGFLAEPEDVAALVLFLAGPESRAITGACYRVDGGLLAKLAH